jgi:hypothetical protein
MVSLQIAVHFKRFQAPQRDLFAVMNWDNDIDRVFQVTHRCSPCSKDFVVTQSGDELVFIQEVGKQK